MYNYETEKSKIFTEENIKLYLKIRDNVKQLLSFAGAFKLEKALGGCAGDSFIMIACVDHLVEIGELKEVTSNIHCAGQNRVFVAAK